MPKTFIMCLAYARVLVVFLIFHGLAPGAPVWSTRLYLSESMSLEWDPKLGTRPVFLDTLGAMVKQESTDLKDPFRVQVRRQKPNHRANIFTAQRIWQQNTALSKWSPKESEDKGCAEIKAGLIQCVRHKFDTNKKPMISEALIFHQNLDLIYLRAQSFKPHETDSKSMVAMMTPVVTFPPKGSK